MDGAEEVMADAARESSYGVAYGGAGASLAGGGCLSFIYDTGVEEAAYMLSDVVGDYGEGVLMTGLGMWLLVKGVSKHLNAHGKAVAVEEMQRRESQGEDVPVEEYEALLERNHARERLEAGWKRIKSALGP